MYNVADDSEDGLALPDGACTTCSSRIAERSRETSSVTTDGGKVFKTKLTPNPFSFNEVYEMNKSVDVRAAYAEVVEGARLRDELL